MGIIEKFKSPFATKGQPDGADDKDKVKKEKRAAALESDYSVLRTPHISERATNFSKEGVYVFKVGSGANKMQIKHAVEHLYRVKVMKVNVINQHGRVRHRGRVVGRAPGYKKAFVTLEKGAHIDILPQ
jgi:large subunit ribosomal protein L23